MNLKKSLSLSIGLSFTFAFVTLSFQNCAQQQDLASSADLTTATAAGSASGDPTAKAAEELADPVPTDSKQTLESMMSLLGLKASDLNMTEVNAEINYRRNLLAPRSDLALVNSPSMIAMTSLAGVVCKQAVNKEKKGTLDVFKYMSFSKGPSAYGKVGAINTYSLMIQRFWMRTPTVDEIAMISQTVDDYFATLDSSALGKATESEKLAIFICAGMLSVPESYLM